LASLKLPTETLNATESIIGDFAMSVEEADAILAKFGFAEQADEALLAA